MYLNEAKWIRAKKHVVEEAKTRGHVEYHPSDEEVKARYLKIGGAWVEKLVDTEPQESGTIEEGKRRGRPRKEEKGENV